MRIAVVGPCGAGKTTLISSPAMHKYDIRHVAQEHSYVPDMWQRIARPDVLIYLHVSYPKTLERKRINWTLSEYNEQIYRLRHARMHTDLIIDTDELTPQEVMEKVLEFISNLTLKSD